jgi:hypothetical protein
MALLTSCCNSVRLGYQARIARRCSLIPDIVHAFPATERKRFPPRIVQKSPELLSFCWVLLILPILPLIQATAVAGFRVCLFVIKKAHARRRDRSPGLAFPSGSSAPCLRAYRVLVPTDDRRAICSRSCLLLRCWDDTGTK